MVSYKNGRIHTYSYPMLEALLDSPHSLIAGTTGSGKSVMLHSLMFAAMARNAYFIFIDLKRVEMADFKDLPNTVAYATEEEDAVKALDLAIAIMEKRYKDMTGKMYEGAELYIVIDEMADLVGTSKKCLERMVRIGRLGRAARVHMICATQDPSRRTLKAQLMQNFTACLALRCKTAIESRQVTGYPGAELLPKHGEGYLWDADGYRKVNIPMIPEEDMNALISISMMDRKVTRRK